MEKEEWSNWYDKRNKESDVKSIVKSEVVKSFKDPIWLDKNNLKKIEKDSKSWREALFNRCKKDYKAIFIPLLVWLSQTLSAQAPHELEDFAEKDTIEIIYNDNLDEVIDSLWIQKEYRQWRLKFDIDRKKWEIGDKIRFVSFKDEHEDIYRIDVEVYKVL